MTLSITVTFEVSTVVICDGFLNLSIACGVGGMVPIGIGSVDLCTGLTDWTESTKPCCSVIDGAENCPVVETGAGTEAPRLTVFRGEYLIPSIDILFFIIN